MSVRTLILGLILTGCPAEETGDTDPADPGAEVYTNSCSACHGVDGLGVDGVGPSLAERVPGKSEADVEDIITNGTGTMTAISGLSADQTSDVAAYVVAEWGD